MPYMNLPMWLVLVAIAFAFGVLVIVVRKGQCREEHQAEDRAFRRGEPLPRTLKEPPPGP